MPPALPLAPQCYPPGAELLHGPPGLTPWYPAGPLIHPVLSSSRGGWLSPPPCSHLPTVPHGLGNLAGPPGAPRPLLPPPAHPLGGPFGGQRDVGNAQSVCGVCRRRGVRFSRPRASRRDPGPPPGCAASCAPLSQRCSQCVRVPPPAPPHAAGREQPCSRILQSVFGSVVSGMEKLTQKYVTWTYKIIHLCVWTTRAVIHSMMRFS